ncbi:hypothetical protein [Parvularcula oceani]|uniref:hypothetical protein n=1 Tax=Parvularcula oceani TaxID=1247963 RepID=UPI0004E14A0C|nr:hypothetical protein [Parvularcula oceani]
MTLLEHATALGDVLRAIPAPTEEWSEIVGHLAWPVTLILFASLLRKEVQSAAGTIARRLETDDIEAGGFRMKSGDSQYDLGDDEDDHAEPDLFGHESDIIETIFEFLSIEGNYSRLVDWMEANLDKGHSIDDFLTATEFADERLRFVQHVVRGG